VSGKSQQARRTWLDIPRSTPTSCFVAEIAEALQAMGFLVAAKSLETRASRGGGPPFKRFGRIPLYRWGDTLDWANTRLTPPSLASTKAA
jgi:hypothetical protein